MAKAAGESSFRRRFFYIFWSVMIVFFISFGLYNGMTLRDIEEEKAGIRAEISEYGERIAELERSRSHFDSDAYIEMLARERLGLVKPDEVVFYKDSK